MDKVGVIAKKEFLSLFTTPMAFVAWFVSWMIFNLFFVALLEQGSEPHLRDVFQIVEFMMLFFVPLMTMRGFAEERAEGTLELLLTSPVTPWQIVLGKFFGYLFFGLILILVLLVYFVVLKTYSQPETLEFVSGLSGIILEMSLFIAIGLWVSSMTKHQMVSAIGSYAILFCLYFSVIGETYLQGSVETVIKHIGLVHHLEAFAVANFSVSNLAYYLVGTIGFLLITRLKLDY